MLRQSVGEGWPVVEDELVVTIVARRPLVNRGLERVVGLPAFENVLFELGEVRLRIDLGV